MRKLSSHFIFTGPGPVLKYGIIVLNDEGVVTDLIDTGGIPSETEGVEFYPGVLCPGFINAHCHLELSHLRGKIKEGGGLPAFIGAINRQRTVTEEELLNSAFEQDRKMQQAGIVAVGDVSNFDAVACIKKQGTITYHTFVELFGFMPERAERAFKTGCGMYNDLKKRGLKASITPHSPYSVSPGLFKLIKDYVRVFDLKLSVHFLETDDENNLLLNKKGALVDHLGKNIGLDISDWKPPGVTAAQWLLQQLPKEKKVLFVHNTFLREKDIDKLETKRLPQNNWFVLCPRSNWYIGRNEPDYKLLMQKKANVCLGTDSIASNHSLSILDEMIFITERHNYIALEELIKWGTFNGAKALDMEDKLGSFETGKTPGVNWLTGVDLKQLRLTPDTKIKVII